MKIDRIDGTTRESILTKEELVTVFNFVKNGMGSYLSDRDCDIIGNTARAYEEVLHHRNKN